MPEILVSSMLSFQNKTGRVQIEMPETDAQLSQDEAAQIAHQIIDTTAAARMDEFLWKFATERLELDDGRAAALLEEWRDFTHAKVAGIPKSVTRNRGKFGNGRR